jgi:hypothetical protein
VLRLEDDVLTRSGADSLDGGTGHVDAVIEYYYTSRSSLRGMYGWARPEFEAAARREGKEVGRVNPGSVTEFQLRMALTRP